MSVEQSNTVDAIGIDRVSGSVVLTISDHLKWGHETGRHLALLQEKINTYLAFIESGELFETYPYARGRPTIIDVVGRCTATPEAVAFFTKAEGIVQRAGLSLRYRQLGNDDPSNQV